jgi:uncharacterized protein YdaU (DUF1376 family)
LNYYEKHLGDYARDTTHLSMLQHGAYNLLLDRYYVKEAPIPADQVYGVAKATTKPERAAVDSVLREFFILQDGAWHKNRCDEEIEKKNRKAAAARANGVSGGRPKQNPTAKPVTTETKPTGFPVGSQNLTHEKALQSPDSRLQSPESGDRAARNSTAVATYARANAQGFDRIRAAYPKFAGRQDWLNAQNACQVLLDSGENWDSLLAATERYAKHIRAKGDEGTQYVKTPGRYFAGNDADAHWRQDWPLPAARVNGHTQKPEEDWFHGTDHWKSMSQAERDEYEESKHAASN